LRWVFVRDPYYEPLLVFAGWRKVDNLDDRSIFVWSKDDVPPATPLNSPQMPTRLQGLMWGILPIGSSILALLVLLIPEQRERYVHEPDVEVVRHPVGSEDLVLGRILS
jgi:hypothetical protein